MGRHKVVLGLITGIAVILTIPGLATAEFKSETTKGKGELAELKLEAGGGSVLCTNYAEATKGTTWSIQKEGKATTKGPSLLMNVEEWGTCKANSSGLSEETASVSGCELEFKQASEEAKLLGHVLTACDIKASGCLISLLPKANEKLKEISLYSFGTKGLALEPEILNAATEVNGACETDGIKGSTKGIITGAFIFQQAQPPMVPEFTVSATRLWYSATLTTGVLVVTRDAVGAAMPTNIAITNFQRPAAFSLNAGELATCKMTLLGEKESCLVGITYTRPVGGARAVVTVAGANAQGDQLDLRGT